MHQSSIVLIISLLPGVTKKKWRWLSPSLTDDRLSMVLEKMYLWIEIGTKNGKPEPHEQLRWF